MEPRKLARLLRKDSTLNVIFDKKEDYIPPSKYVKIKPKGFWLDIIHISQDRDLKTLKLKESEIKWGSGGMDGSLSNIEGTEAFILSLQEAVKLAKLWNEDLFEELPKWKPKNVVTDRDLRCAESEKEFGKLELTVEEVADELDCACVEGNALYRSSIAQKLIKNLHITRREG